jgi:peptide/nickel transport system ATP-binding protein
VAISRQVATQVVVLRAGRVVESGPADDVLSRPRDPYTQRLLASVPVPDPRVQRTRRERALAPS